MRRRLRGRQTHHVCRVEFDFRLDIIALPPETWTIQRVGLSPKFLPVTSRALGRFDAHRWA